MNRIINFSGLSFQAISSLLTLSAVLSFSGCGTKSDEEAAPSGAAGAADQDTGSAGAGGADAVTAKPLYAISTLTTAPDNESSVSYVNLIDELDGQVDFDEGREFSGTADLWLHEGALFVSDSETKIITKFAIENRKLVEDEQVSFVNYGPNDFGFWVNNMVAPDKAYFYNASSEEFVVWNPKDMSIVGSFPLPELPEHAGFKKFGAYSDRAALERGNLLYQPFYFTDEDFIGFAETTSIVVIDTDKDEVVDVLEAPCPGIDFATRDDDDNLYFSSWVFSPGGALQDAPTTCVAKIAAGETEIKKLFDVPDVTDGRQGGVMRYLGDGKALLSVLHPEHAGPGDDLQAVTFGANWHFWLYDLANGTASELETLDWSAGAAYSNVIDGEMQLLVPAGDYSSTDLYTVATDGSARQRLHSAGWSLRLFPIDAQ